jgi:hypothetical protein
MTRANFCPACRQPFEVPEHAQGAWLVCPHCHGRVANLGASRSERRESLGCLGVLLGAVGGGLMGLFLLCGVPGILLANPGLFGDAQARALSPLALSLLWALAGAFLFLAGVLCVRAADRAEGRPPKLLGALFAVLAGATLSVMLALAMWA